MNYTTSCKGCCFAKIVDDKQVGCHARDMKNEFHCAYDNNLEYRVIRRYCHFKRLENWHPTLSVDDKLKEVDKEIELKYNFIIYNRKNLTSLDDVAAQELQPQSVIVVENNIQDVQQTIKRLNNYNFKHWTVYEIKEQVDDWRDDVINKHAMQIMVFIEDGTFIPMDFFKNLNQKINYEDLRFGCIEGDGILIIPLGVYKMILSPLRDILNSMESTGFKRLKYEDISSGKV